MKKTLSLIWHPLVAGLIFVLTLPGGTWLLRHVELSPPLRLAVVLLRVVGAVYYILLWLQWSRRFDELQKRIQLQSLGWGVALSFVGLILVDSLDKAAIPFWRYDDVWQAAFIVGYLFGYVKATRQYQ